MEVVTFGDVEVDRCDGCQGIWFDGSELTSLLGQIGSESIDTGDREVGQSYDGVEGIGCPRGHGPLARMVDPNQSHIWYERCPVCGGAFLDAGEFSDLKSKSLMDLFRALVG